jgi:LuxR family maltose regulon positive regulatory protein
MLMSEWLHTSDLTAAWVSLDKGDNDLARFLAYFIASLQIIDPAIGSGSLGLLQSPQPPATEMILTALLNEIVKMRSSNSQGKRGGRGSWLRY